MKRNVTRVLVSKFACWLCGYKMAADSKSSEMRDRRCPSCQMDAAFVPVEERSVS